CVRGQRIRTIGPLSHGRYRLCSSLSCISFSRSRTAERWERILKCWPTHGGEQLRSATDTAATAGRGNPTTRRAPPARTKRELGKPPPTQSTLSLPLWHVRVIEPNSTTAGKIAA